jgi:hypothetical protein
MREHRAARPPPPFHPPVPGTSVMSAPTSVRLALSAVTLAIGPAVTKAGDEPGKADAHKEVKYYKPDGKKDVPWTAKVDAATVTSESPAAAWKGVGIAFQGRKVIYPEQPSPYAVLSPKAPKGKKDDGSMRVYDLRSGTPTGKPFKTEIALAEHAALAPDGSYLAHRLPGKQNPHTITVIDTATGESIRKIEAGQEKEWSLPILFVGPDRLLTQTHESQVPDWTEKTEYKLWNVRTGELLSEFAFDLVWSATSVGVSPGGKYIVFRTTKTGIGQRLIITEIATGKVVGDVTCVGKEEPFGGSGGIVFSPDGKEIAILWVYLGGKKEKFGKVLVFDAATGKKLASHDIPEMKGADTNTKGGAECIQWVPDGSGWLLYGMVLVDRKTRKELAHLGGDKKLAHLHRFVGPEYLTAFKGGLDANVSLEPVKAGHK